MKRAVLLTLLVLIGCKKSNPEATDPGNTPAAAPVSKGPTKKLIESGTPEFDAMLAEFKADPKTKKFEREIVTFVMAVESVKEVNKETYLVKGKGDGVNLVCTFLLPKDLELNRQAPTLAAGDKVTYMAEPAGYKPGTPPTITGLSGSILGVERK